MITAPDGHMSYAHFQNGVAFVHTRMEQAWLMNRAIRDKWVEFGETAGVFGYPNSVVSDDNFKVTFAIFDGGRIYSGLDIGTHAIQGPLADWVPASNVGYPTSDAMPWVNPANGNTGLIVNCQEGRVAYTSEDGIIHLPN